MRTGQAAVDRDRLSIDIARLIARKEKRDIGEFLGLRRAAQGVELAELVRDLLGLGIVEGRLGHPRFGRSEEHTSELQSLMRISYADICSKKKTHIHQNDHSRLHP